MGTGVVGQPVEGVREMELGDELSLFDPATGTAYALNRTARDVWALADGVTPVEDVVAVLARAYGTSPEAIGQQVRATLAQLAEHGVLVEPAD